MRMWRDKVRKDELLKKLIRSGCTCLSCSLARINYCCETVLILMYEKICI